MNYAHDFDDDLVPLKRGQLRQRHRRPIVRHAMLGCAALLIGWLFEALPAGQHRNDAAALLPPIAFSNPYAANADSGLLLKPVMASLGGTAPVEALFKATLGPLQDLASAAPPETSPPEMLAKADPAEATGEIKASEIKATPAEQWALSMPLPTPRPQQLRGEPTTASGEVPQPEQKIAGLQPDATQVQPQTEPQAPQRQTSRRMRRELQAAAPAVPAPDSRSFVQKLFGISPEKGPALAYAAPQDGEIGVSSRFGGLLGSRSSISAGDKTAVYDISARTVYMPNGDKLEAHSGLGPKMDDPRFVHVKMHGSTPPHVYNLALRERLFHGVRAIRLHPVDPSQIHGRTGLLAHSYMLGPRGDSNGCVSFKDYNKFLQAYLRGEVTRLVVVAKQS